MLSRILAGSAELLTAKGLEGWSLQQVAERAGCAKALILHHFGSKVRILMETGRAIQRSRLERRLAALAWEGTSSLDRLWSVILDDSRSGLTRATLALGCQGYLEASDRGSQVHEAAARALAIEPAALATPVALMAMLDGIELQLVLGTDEAAARAAFDRLWVTMIDVA